VLQILSRGELLPTLNDTMIEEKDEAQRKPKKGGKI